MQKAVEQHGGMAHGQHEAISVHPLWRVRVVVQDPLVQLMAPTQGVAYREGMKSYETLYFPCLNWLFQSRQNGRSTSCQ
jgi:hypothetical protein